MAKGKGGESVGNLYLRLGLNYDELNQDFVAVEETLSSNIQRLNRQNKLIDIKAKIDFIGVTDAEQKIKIQQEALTRQIELQTQKVKLYESAWIAAGKANGLASKQAENAAIALKQQQLELANLSQRLKEVAEQQKQINQTKIDKANFDNSLLGRYTNIKGDVSGIIGNITNAFTGLKDATSSADAAITKSLEIIGSIPSTAGKVVAALASIPLVVKGIENSLLDLAKPAIAAGDAIYVLSRGMQTSIADAAKFSTVCKVTGIDINEVNNAMKLLSMQIAKSGEKGNAVTNMLQEYGANLRDVNGDLKNSYELSIEVSKAFAKAQEAGRGKEFIATVFRRSATGDVVTYLEDLAGNIELANKIVKNGLADPKLAHNMQGNLNALNTQAGQLESAFSSAFMPMAEELIPRATERLGELTKVIADNAEGIKEFGKTAAAILNTVGDVAGAATKTVINTVGTLSEYHVTDALLDPTGLYREIALLKDFKEKRTAAFANQYAGDKEIQSAKDLQAKMPRYTAEYYEEVFEKIKEIRKKTEEETKKIQELADKSLDIRFFREGLISDEALENIRKTTKATQDLSDELYKLTHNDYENKQRDVWNWRHNLLNVENVEAEQRVLIEQITTAKLEQIEREHADKLAEIRESVASLDRTVLENKLADIEKEKQAWIKAGMEEAEAVELAQRKIEEVKKESLEKINSYLRDAASIEYGLTHDAFEKQLYDIERWKDAQLEKAETAEEVSATIANAAMKEADAFEREMDRIKGKIESAQDRLARLTLSSYENDIRSAEKQYQKDLAEGIPKELAVAIRDASIRQAQKRRIEDTSGNYSRRPTGNYGASQFIDFNNAIEQSTKSLTELDAEQIARKATEEKMGRSAAEIESAFNGVDLATSTYNDVVKDMTNGSESALEKFQQALQDTDINVDDLQSRIDAASGNIQSLGDSALQNAQRVESTADTFNRAMTMVNAIEEQKRNSQSEPESQRQQSFEIMYGDADILESMQRWRDTGVEINYGDLPEWQEFGTAVDNAATSLNDLTNSTPNFDELINSTGQVTTSMGELITSSEQLRDEQIKLANTPIVPDDLPAALSSLGEGSSQAATKFEETTAKLETVGERLSNLNSQSQVDDTSDDIASRALEATSAIGGAIALGGVATAQPEVAFVGEGISVFADLLKVAIDNLDMSAVDKALSDISQGLNDISQRTGEIVQSANKPPQQNINVSPNITIDLGGAYVFDDSMKAQLTDDITREVANAVTDAVSKATSQVDYGYGN